MSGVQQRLKLKQTPIDTWSLKEQLTLASAVLRTGDQNWVSVSRTMKQFWEPGRPPDWYSQKNCALQYNLILEKADLPRRKRGEKLDGADSPGQLIVKSLGEKREEQLKKIIAAETAEIARLEKQVELLSSDNVSQQEMDKMIKEIEQEEEEEARKEEEHVQFIKTREERKLAIQAALKTGLYWKTQNIRSSISEQSGSEVDSAMDSPVPAEEQTTEPDATAVVSETSAAVLSRPQTVNARLSVALPASTSHKTESSSSSSSSGVVATVRTTMSTSVLDSKKEVMANDPQPNKEIAQPKTTSSYDQSEKGGDAVKLNVDSEQNSASSSGGAQSSSSEAKMKVETEADSSSLPTAIKKETLVTAEEEKLSSGSTPATVEAAITKTDNTDIETITVKMEDDIKCETGTVKIEGGTETSVPVDENSQSSSTKVTLADPSGNQDGSEPMDTSCSTSAQNSSSGDALHNVSNDAMRGNVDKHGNDDDDEEEDVENDAEEITGGDMDDDISDKLSSESTKSDSTPSIATTIAEVEEDSKLEKVESGLTKSTEEETEPGENSVKETTADQQREEEAPVEPLDRENLSQHTADTIQETIEVDNKSDIASKSTTSSKQPTSSTTAIGSASVASVVSTMISTVSAGGGSKADPVSSTPQVSTAVTSVSEIKVTPRRGRPRSKKKLDTPSTTPAVQSSAAPSTTSDTPPPPPRIEFKDETDTGADETSRASTPAVIANTTTTGTATPSSSSNRPTSPSPEVKTRSGSRESAVTSSSSGAGGDTNAACGGMTGSSTNTTVPASRVTSRRFSRQGGSSRGLRESGSGDSSSRPGSPSGSGSGVGLDDEKEAKAWRKSIGLVLSQIAAHKHASLFAGPVSEAEAPEYRQIVFRPMDLGTIKKNIDSGVIRTTEEFQRDLRLMFFNATMYNSSEHAVYRLTRSMQRDADNIVREYLHTQALMKANEAPKLRIKDILETTGGTGSRTRTGSGSHTPDDRKKTDEKRKRTSTTEEYPTAKKRRLRHLDE